MKKKSAKTSVEPPLHIVAEVADLELFNWMHSRIQAENRRRKVQGLEPLRWCIKVREQR